MASPSDNSSDSNAIPLAENDIPGASLLLYSELVKDNTAAAEFPTTGWGTSLEKMPMFTRLQMNHHVLKSGKTIGNIDHQTVPTGLVKARRFLDDEYLEDIECASDSKYFFKGKCCHSLKLTQTKNSRKIKFKTRINLKLIIHMYNCCVTF